MLGSQSSVRPSTGIPKIDQILNDRPPGMHVIPKDASTELVIAIKAVLRIQRMDEMRETHHSLSAHLERSGRRPYEKSPEEFAVALFHYALSIVLKTSDARHRPSHRLISIAQAEKWYHLLANQSILNYSSAPPAPEKKG